MRKAINIQWDTDGDSTINLPTEIEIPAHLTDEDEISDYLSESTGFCHFGFEMVEQEDSEGVSVDDIIDAAETLDWTVRADENNGSFGLEFRKYSPAGEDFMFYANTEGYSESRVEAIVSEVRSYAYDFDPEEHAVMHLGGRGAPGLFDLCEDAKAIEAMLQELADALYELLHGKPVSIAETVAKQTIAEGTSEKRYYKVVLGTRWHDDNKTCATGAMYCFAYHPLTKEEVSQFLREEMGVVFDLILELSEMTREEIWEYIDNEDDLFEIGDSYAIVAYDKDNDVYVDLGHCATLPEAKTVAEKLKELLERDELRRKENREPFDWLEIYCDFGGATEKRVWASYDTPGAESLSSFELVETKTLKDGYLFQRWEGIGYEMTIRQYSETGFDIHVTPDKEYSLFIPRIYIGSDDEGRPTDARIQTTSYGALSIEQYTELQRAMTLAICAAEDIEKIIAHLKKNSAED